MRTAACLLLAVALSAAGAEPVPPAPKNVILLVGDGMGATHLAATKQIRGDDFQIGRMPVAALVTTHAADSAVTDSAAAASALATGEKTKYRAVSVDADGKPRRTVLEAAEAAGRSTGLVTTTGFWDATPAAFSAHAADRYADAASIVDQILRSGVDVIASGGLELLGQKDLPPVEHLKSAGFAVAADAADLTALAGEKVAALFTSGTHELDPARARLPDLTRWAVAKLSSDADGFFLLVEHEGIDGASHANSNDELRSALTSFDESVGAALDFAAADGTTLVIVVGDHETGGMRMTETRDLRRWRTEWSTTEHTGNPVVLFAFGPGSEAFSGFLDNTQVGRKLLALQGK